MGVGMPEESANPPASEPEESGELMYVRCSVCGEWLGVKPGGLHLISHGLCPACQERELKRLMEELARRRKPWGSAAGNDSNTD